MAAALDDDTAKKIIRQVEFYFSDSNLPRDKFLRTTVEQSDDGLVSLALICSFARMRNHLGLGVVKPEEVPEETVLAVAEVLRKSSSLRVSEDGKNIGRSSELLKPEEVIEQVDSRTVAASPFPYDVTLEDVQTFFGHKGKVNSVRLPPHVCNKRVFCGTALIEFSDEVDAKQILQEKLVYDGADLELNPKKDFDAERQKKREEIEINRFNKDSSNGSYPKGLILAFKLKHMTTETSVKKNALEKLNGVEVTDAELPKSNEIEKTSEHSDNEDKTSEDVEKGEEKGNAQDEEFKNEEKAAATQVSQQSELKIAKDSPTDVEVKIGNFADCEDVVKREDLKPVFQKFGTVKYIDYSMGDESGFIRFEDPDAAVKARAVAVLTEDGGLVVKKNYIATLEALTGEAEKGYWSLLQENKGKHNENKSYRGRGKQNRGGRYFDGKRLREVDSFKGPPNKAQKSAD